ncbi:MAG: hypothetical protein WA867_03355, partial [Candidatus Acidiferrales bacterium]
SLLVSNPGPAREQLPYPHSFECLSPADNRQRKLRSVWSAAACLAAFSTSNFSAETSESVAAGVAQQPRRAVRVFDQPHALSLLTITSNGDKG